MTTEEKILAALDDLAGRLERIEARLEDHDREPPAKLGYSVREAAELTGIGQHEIRAMIRRGDLRAVRPGASGRGPYRIPASQLAAAMEDMAGRPTTEPTPQGGFRGIS